MTAIVPPETPSVKTPPIAEVERVLRENGLTDNPAEFDGDIHSWRCSYPDIYGPCSCFAELVSGLAALFGGVA